jgi:hypothetical protein
VGSTTKVFFMEMEKIELLPNFRKFYRFEDEEVNNVYIKNTNNNNNNNSNKDATIEIKANSCPFHSSKE